VAFEKQLRWLFLDEAVGCEPPIHVVGLAALYRRISVARVLVMNCLKLLF